MSGSRGFIFALLGLVVLHGWSMYSAQAEVHYYTFVLEEKNFTKLCSTKSIITVNGTFPGPEITVSKGDTAVIKVINNGTYGVTIHWHGVKQPRNPWSDGPENVTQCPIKAGDSFTQTLIFSDEEGTLWWHAHSDWTRATVHGAILVLPTSMLDYGGYPYSVQPHASQTIVLGEWYIDDVMEIFENATATGAAFPESDAYTINGEPGDLYNCSNTTTFRMTVETNKTYLLRIISAIMNEDVFFGIANHTLRIVGMDGAYLKPVDVEFIMITPGQTMDVLVTANQAPSHYYMETNPYAETPPAFADTKTTAIIVYKGTYTPPSTPYSPTLPESSNMTAATNFTSSLKSLNATDVPTNITKRIFMTVSVNQIYCPNATCGGPNGNRAAASLTNISFATPSIDILQAYYWNLSEVYNGTFPDFPSYEFNYTGDVGDNTLYPSVGTEVIMVDYNEEVEIVWQGTNIGASESHPMHLHGYSFYVVGMGDGNFDNETSGDNYNTVDPPLVNTIGVPKNGWATIRFKADNPGVWFMHCHFEKHASWGMATVLIVKNGPTAEKSMLPPPTSMPSCS